jgi:DNA-binding NtrC family response regulator
MDNSPSELPSGAGGSRPQVSDELRILVLAPTSNDARLTGQFLEKAGLCATICTDLADLSECLRAGCGALLLAEEALASEALGRLVAELEGQPSWSDLPFILITGSGEEARVRSRLLAALDPVGNISIIERPVRPGTLVSTCEVALRSRARQYQVRNLLKDLRR